MVKNKAGYVYFIKNDLFEGYKIGRAKDYKTRISSLNTSFPIEHAFIKEMIIKCGNYVQAEKDMHDFLSKYRCTNSREFFDLKDDDDLCDLFEYILTQKSWKIVYISPKFKEYLEQLPSNKEIHEWLLGVLSNLEEEHFLAEKNESDFFGRGPHHPFDEEYMYRIYGDDFKLYFDNVFDSWNVSEERLKQIISSSHELMLDESTGEIWR